MKKIINYILILPLLFSLVACESTEISKEVPEDLISAQLLQENIKSISIKPIMDKLDLEFEISFEFEESVENLQLPDALVLSEFPGVEPLRINAGNKLRYSTVTTSEDIKRIYMDSLGDKELGDTVQGFKFICKVSFSLPGQYDENCKDVCSEESILGAESWFCVCLYECEFGYEE